MLHLQPLTESKRSLNSSISFKHILENSDHYLIEINKIYKGDVFPSSQWLKVSKDLSDVKVLALKSIDSSFEVEERFFEEGYLKFNNNNGVFIEKFNSGQHQYRSNGQGLEGILTSFLYDYFFGSKALLN